MLEDESEGSIASSSSRDESRRREPFSGDRGPVVDFLDHELNDSDDESSSNHSTSSKSSLSISPRRERRCSRQLRRAHTSPPPSRSPTRQRSKSPLRRTRSDETAKRLQNSISLLDLDNSNSELGDDSATSYSESTDDGSLCPAQLSKSPPRRCMPGDSSSLLVNCGRSLGNSGFIMAKARRQNDQSPMPPRGCKRPGLLTRNDSHSEKSGGSRRGLLSRAGSCKSLLGGSLSRGASSKNLLGGSLSLKRGNSNPSLLEEVGDSSSGRPPRRGLTRGGSSKSLMRGLSRANSSMSLMMPTRGVRATKSAEGIDLHVGSLRRGALRATKSAFDVLTGSSDHERGSNHEARQDPMFVEMVQWNPLDPDDRVKYHDETVRKVIKKNPDAVRASYHVQVGRSTVSRSALSTLVALGASLGTIRAAIKAHPAALEATCTLRTTPLHTACSFETDMMVLKYLYHKCPEAIKATTKHVFLPLHNACQMACPSLEMIQFLVKAYPEGLTEINKLGDTPLRTAERNESTPLEVILYLQQETDRVFSQSAENQDKRRAILARQSWGSKELSKCFDALGGLDDKDLDDTDHTTISTADMDSSEMHLSSEEFAEDHSSRDHHMSLPNFSRSHLQSDS